MVKDIKKIGFLFFFLIVIFLNRDYYNQLDETIIYINKFDASDYMESGLSYDDPNFSPDTLGKPLDEIDTTYDYDFDRLAEVEKLLLNVDRKEALQHIFETVTKDARSEIEKHVAVLVFLQKVSIHNIWKQPMYPDGSTVYDPLVLLELKEMRCGHIARVTADLFSAAGYKTRIVQLGGHVIAEIYYEGEWHYFDADVFGNGETVLGEDQNIPSVFELSQPDTLWKMDSLSPPSLEGTIIYGPIQHSIRYYSYLFYKDAYVGYSPMYYVKTATEDEENNRFYG